MKSISTRKFDTDALMINIWKHLARDFRSKMNDRTLWADEESALELGVKSYRNYVHPDRLLAPVNYFKCSYQLQHLFKRYRFKDDLFTDEELEFATTQKFLSTQVRIAVRPVRTMRSYAVIQRARKIIKEILGNYDEEEHMSLCRFGKRASVGCPGKESYIDTKLGRPLTGSQEHIEWFKRYLNTDKLLVDVIHQCSPTGEPMYQRCDTLALTNVAKTFKSLRTIMPNTLLGGFYTHGVGRMIQKRLTSIKLNIKNLQSKHRRLVLMYSRTRTHVTADLSAASDSFTWELVCRLLPRKWLAVINLGRIKQVMINGKTNSLQSFMTMGIGFTFPLQTLLFYGILKAIQQLSGIKGTVSVYGDDLIYPTKMHTFVNCIFTDIGFILNEDKTFVKQDFRESCGADAYCGVEVRPFSPKSEFRWLPDKSYVLQLYKTINGLLARWDRKEINQTIRFLYSEILRVDTSVLIVPPLYPDYSGVRCDSPAFDHLTFHRETGSNPRLWNVQFDFYKLHARDRVVKHQIAFYWESLRCKISQDEDYDFNPYDISDSMTIAWRKTNQSFRSKLSGKRLRYLMPVVAKKAVNPAVICQTGSTSCWSEASILG